MVCVAFSEGLATCWFPYSVMSLNYLLYQTVLPTVPEFIVTTNPSHLSHKQKKLLEHFPRDENYSRVIANLSELFSKIVIDGMLLSQNIRV